MNYSNYSKLLQHELLSKSETYSLIEQYQQCEDPLIKRSVADKLIRSNFKFIYKLSANFYHSHRDCPVDEYIQIGMEAMLRTLDRFDLSSGYTLLTYYSFWNYSFNQRYWARHKAVIRVANHAIELVRSIRKTQAQYEMLHGVSPSTGEVAEQLGITPEKVKETLLSTRPATSLNKLTFNDDGNSPTEILDLITETEDTNYSPDDYLTSLSKLETLSTLLNSLNRVEREIIEMKYGLNKENKVYTLKQISESLNLTIEAVRSKAARAIRELRKQPELRELKQYI